MLKYDESMRHQISLHSRVDERCQPGFKINEFVDGPDFWLLTLIDQALVDQLFHVRHCIDIRLLHFHGDLGEECVHVLMSMADGQIRDVDLPEYLHIFLNCVDLFTQKKYQ